MKFNCDDCCYDINLDSDLLTQCKKATRMSKKAPPSKMLLTLYSLPEILFSKRHGLKGLYSWGVSWGVAYVPTMQLKKLATMNMCNTKHLVQQSDQW